MEYHVGDSIIESVEIHGTGDDIPLEHCLTEVTVTSKSSKEEIEVTGQRLKPTFKKRFIKSWCNHPALKDWLQEKDGMAFCVVCNTLLKPGKTELLRHNGTNKHQKMMLESIGNAAVSKSSSSKSELRKLMTLDFDYYSEHLLTNDLRQAIRNAECGDDEHQADKSTWNLEIAVAMLLRQEAGLYVHDPLLANFLSMEVYAMDGTTQVIAGENSQMALKRRKLLLSIPELAFITIPNNSDGTFSIEELLSIINTDRNDWPVSTVVCIEQVHYMSGGTIIPTDWINMLHKVCQEYGISIHMDGIMLLNAQCATKNSLPNMVQHCSSVSFRLPIFEGAVIAGSKAFIKRARYIRNSWGYCISNPGLLTSPTLYHLNSCTDLLPKEHSNAEYFVKKLGTICCPLAWVNQQEIQTNIVMLHLDDACINATEFCSRIAETPDHEKTELKQRVKIIAKAEGYDRVVFVLSSHHTLSELDITARKLKYVLEEYQRNIMT